MQTRTAPPSTGSVSPVYTCSVPHDPSGNILFEVASQPVTHNKVCLSFDQPIWPTSGSARLVESTGCTCSNTGRDPSACGHHCKMQTCGCNWAADLAVTRCNWSLGDLTADSADSDQTLIRGREPGDAAHHSLQLIDRGSLLHAGGKHMPC